MDERGHIITWERAAKGDLEISHDAAGFMSKASRPDRSILHKLHQSRILTCKHIEAASTYAGWQYAFQRPFYAEPRRVYLLELMGDGLGDVSHEGNYRKLLRLLSRLDQHFIEMALDRDWDDSYFPLNRQFVVAFDFLVKAVENVLAHGENSV